MAVSGFELIIKSISAIVVAELFISPSLEVFTTGQAFFGCGCGNHCFDFLQGNQLFIRVQTFINGYSRKQTNKNRLPLFCTTIFVLSIAAVRLTEIKNSKF